MDDFSDFTEADAADADETIDVPAGNSWLLIVVFTIVVGAAAAWHFGFFLKEVGRGKAKEKAKKKKGKKGHTTSKARVSKHTRTPPQPRGGWFYKWRAV